MVDRIWIYGVQVVLNTTGVTEEAARGVQVVLNTMGVTGEAARWCAVVS